MANSTKRQRRLWDAYAFPGFRPQSTVRGVLGDPKARVISLVRRSKKRSAVAADRRTWVGTTGARAAREICPAAMRASTSNSRCGAYSARAAAK
jgi:hypothetical protein